MRPPPRAAVAALLSLSLATRSIAEPPEPLDLRVTRVVAWKNGVAAVTREGKVPARPGLHAIELPVPPLHGTFWLGLPDGTDVAFVDGPVDGLAAVHGGSGSHPAVVRLRDGGGELRGTLVPAQDVLGTWGHPLASFVALDVEGRVHLLPSDRIASLELAPGASGSMPRAAPGSLASVRFDEVSPGRFEITWLARGFAWAPSYRVELGESGSAWLSASATLVNDMEDLEDVEVRLVTGAPNVALAHVPSPLAAGTDLDGFLRALAAAPAEVDSRLANQVVLGMGARGEMAAGAYRLGGVPDLGLSVEDLHVVPLPGVTVARHGTTWRPLWSARVPAEHVYRWEIPDSVEEEGRRRAESTEMAPPEAWHSLRLTNVTKTPWSTGPALAVRDGVVLSQDALPFTPAGETSLLRIARATGLVLDDQEQETARGERTSLPAWGHVTEVQLAGTLRARNLTGRALRLEIVKHASGKVASSDPPAEVRTLPPGARRLNPRIDLRWELPLAAGEERVVSYAYSALARH